MKSASVQRINALQRGVVSQNGSTMLGASGALFGVLIGFALLFPSRRLQLIFPPVSFTAKRMIQVFGTFTIVMAFAQYTDFLGGNGFMASIGHTTHLGGLIFGFVMYKLL